MSENMVCIHGCLERSCPHCELADAENEINNLRDLRDVLINDTHKAEHERDEAVKQLRRQDAAVASLRTQFYNIEHKHNACQLNTDVLHDEIASLEAALEVAEDERNNVLGRADIWFGLNNDMSKGLNDALGETAQLRTQLEDATTEIANTDKITTKLMADCEELRRRICVADNDIIELEYNLQEAWDKTEELQKDNYNFRTIRKERDIFFKTVKALTQIIRNNKYDI